MNTKTVANERFADSPGVTIKPPHIFFICLVAGGVMEIVFPCQFPFLPISLRIILGVFLSCSGFAFMTWAHEKFKKIETNVSTNLPATTVVMQGAYRVCRNPMYVGGSIFFIGLGVAFGSIWLLGAYIPLGLYVALYVVPREEAYMTRAFGVDYTTYCNQVRRWI